MTCTRTMHLVILAALATSVGGCRAKKPEPKPEASEKAGQAEPGEGKKEVAETDEKEKTPDRIELGEEALKELRLEYYQVDERELAPALEVSAELVPDPDRRADIGSRTAARVVEFKVKIGDRVERGQLLAVLESAEVGKARAELTAAVARAEVARTAYAREKSLADARATSQKDVQEAEATRRTTEAEVAAARTLLATLGAAAGDEASHDDPARLLLRAPIRGIVLARNAHIGQSVEPTATLLEVADLDQLWLEAQVYEREMRFVSPGQPVQVEVRAYPGEVFKGKVERIGDKLDEKTRAVTVRVSLPNPGHRLKPGMFALARIVGTRAKDARRMLALPWAAVQEIDGHPSVFVREGERAFELRRVHTGERAGDLVEVLNGVKAGDEVVAKGSFLLKGELLKSTLGEEE
jgi:cobalt-zinc-cadmium efflux system membrane fusion protein